MEIRTGDLVGVVKYFVFGGFELGWGTNRGDFGLVLKIIKTELNLGQFFIEGRQGKEGGGQGVKGQLQV